MNNNETQKYPYFRFTEWRDFGTVLKWFKHFMDENIVCCLTRRKKRGESGFVNYTFAVWRMGEEAYGDHQHAVPNSEEIDGEIICSYLWGYVDGRKKRS